MKVSWSGGDSLTTQANLKFDLRKRSYEGGAWGPWSSALTNTSLRAITTRLSPGPRSSTRSAPAIRLAT